MGARIALGGIALIFLGWAAFSTNEYVCRIKGLCYGSNAAVAEQIGTVDSPTSTENASSTAFTAWVPDDVKTACSGYLKIDLSPRTIGHEKEVRALEHFLNAFENAAIPEDGRYGTDTIAAVKAFQEHYRPIIKDVSGAVGPRTKNIINMIVCNAAKSASGAQ